MTTTTNGEIAFDIAPNQIEFEVDPRVQDVVTWVRANLRGNDAPAVLTALQNLGIVEPDAPDFKLSQFLHRSLTSNAIFDGATQQELKYLQPPPMVREDLADALKVDLPAPSTIDLPFSEVLDERRSTYNFEQVPLPLDTLSSLLYNAAGFKGCSPAYNVRDFPLRIPPSAGGLQPMDIYLACNNVEGVDKGVYYFDPVEHALREVDAGNTRGKILEVTIYAHWMFYAPVVMFFVHNMERVNWKYGTRGYRFAHVDLGVWTEAFYLVSSGLDLACCAVAAFDDEACNDFLRLDGRNEFTSLLFAVGPKPQL